MRCPVCKRAKMVEIVSAGVDNYAVKSYQCPKCKVEVEVEDE